MRLLGDRNWWLPRRLARWVATRLPLVEGATLVQVAVLALLLALVAGACSPGGAILANAPAAVPSPPPSPGLPVPAVHDPQPLVFPRDDGPHDRLTEWWYYTGHLHTASGASYGFEFVIFRAERGVFPVSWASHLALTDEGGGRFVYDQRSEIGPQVSQAVPGGGFALAITARDSVGLPLAGTTPWTMRGANGHDMLDATSASAGFGLHLTLDPGALPPVLHDGDGYVSFGAAGGSYYYSRPRLSASGTLQVNGQVLPVTGEAWFDHQWGDFIAVGGGGWDWFAVDLADGSALTLSQVRAADGTYPLVYGTLMHPGGTSEHLSAADFTVQVTAHWMSPRTGTTYPAGWRISLPAKGLVIDLRPTVADQELDTRSTTGVVYWEGSQVVTATQDGRPLAGQAYVELTGYGPAAPSSASSAP
jgi:predicted secreted hydrolase